jgi:putative ABC transport system permease protein
MATWFRRLVHALRGARAAAALREEMEAHRASRQEQLEREGLTPDEAARASRKAFGNLALAADDVRDIWIVRWVDTLRQDVRNGVRMLLKYPGVTSIAMLSLALGIGANTAVFSVINAALLRPLPYRDPDALVMIRSVPPDNPTQLAGATAPELVAWQANAKLFETMGTQFILSRTLSPDDSGSPAEVIPVQMLEPSLCDALRVQPSLGRLFRPDEARVGAVAPVALLSERMWEERYGRDPAILNRVIRLSGVPTTIVGVLPKGFSILSNGRIDVFVPFAFNPPQLRGSARAFSVVGRLNAGVTLEQAQAEMDAIAGHIEGQLPPASKGWRPRLQPLREAIYGNQRPALMLLQAIVACVLLIACGNVAGLLLARATTRQTEIAVRAAIGAERSRIVRQLLTESVVLTAAGGVAGLGVSWAALRAFATVSDRVLPGLTPIAMDVRVLVFTLTVSVVTGLVFGSLPSLRSSRPDLVTALKASLKGSTGGVGRQRLRGALVIGQIGLACFLLIGAGLLVTSFVRLKGNELGGDPKGVLRFTVPFTGDRYLRQTGTFKGSPLLDVSPIVGQSIDRILERMQHLPGVQAVAGASVAPFTGGGPQIPFDIQGRVTAAGDAQLQSAQFQLVTPGFFSTMRIPIIRGRAFDASDTPTGPWSVVINEAAARRFWAGEDPIGQRVLIEVAPDEQPREVVGIVTNFRATASDRETQPAMYILHSQQPPHTRGPVGTVMRIAMSFLIRTAGPPAALTADVRTAMSELERDLPLASLAPLEEDVAAVIKPYQFTMQVLLLCAGVAALLATIGIFGVVSFDVGRRTREIGVRMALGATRADVLQLVMRHVVLIVAVGLVVGMAGAIAAAQLTSRSIAGALWGVEPIHIPTYLWVALVMAAIGLLAGFIPARQAVRVAPTVALRSE